MDQAQSDPAQAERAHSPRAYATKIRWITNLGNPKECYFARGLSMNKIWERILTSCNEYERASLMAAEGKLKSAIYAEIITGAWLDPIKITD